MTKLLIFLSSDQTPTPTRFLKHCDESGLFQELAIENPFEQDFQKVTPGPGSSAKQPTQQEDEAESGAQGKSGVEGRTESATVTVSTSTLPISSATRLQNTVSTAIPVAPPANLVNPEKPVSIAIS